jgi:hypothetical protein
MHTISSNHRDEEGAGLSHRLLVKAVPSVVMGYKEHADAAYVNLTMQKSKKFISGTGSDRFRTDISYIDEKEGIGPA